MLQKQNFKTYNVLKTVVIYNRVLLVFHKCIYDMGQSFRHNEILVNEWFYI